MADYPTRRNPRLILGVIITTIVILVAAIAVVNTPANVTLRVYTYDSFLVWGDDPDTIDQRVFGPFERAHGVNVEIVRLPTDASGIVSRLAAESSNPVADVVIGIDNILVLEDIIATVLEPYTPTNLSLIDSQLVNTLDSEHYVVPFDFGLVTLIYSKNTINTTTHPQLENLTLSALADPELAGVLVTEDPHFSSPGLSFLLAEIAMSEKLLGQDWDEWWIDVNDYIDVQPGWSEAWSKWYEDPTRHLMVSYGTDPAYSSYITGAEPDTVAAPFYHNGVDYAWMQVEGIGLVKNNPNPDLAKLFIEYCLSPAVQSYISLNQWMFPANMDVELDPVFDYALHPDDVELLNDLLLGPEIKANKTSWLNQWDIIRTG